MRQSLPARSVARGEGNKQERPPARLKSDIEPNADRYLQIFLTVCPPRSAPVLTLVRRHLSAPELKKLAPRIVSVDDAAATGTAAGTTEDTL